MMALTMTGESVPPERAVAPLTERILPAGRLARWLAIVAWSAIPFARLAVLALMLAAAGVVARPLDTVATHLAGTTFNAYTLLVVLLGIRPVSRQLAAIAVLGDARTARVARLSRSIIGPLLLAVAFTFLSETSEIVDFGAAQITATPVPFVIAFLIAFLIRLPQAVALWTAVVALATIAALGTQPVPGTFPEDRSLGLRNVGHLLTTILLFFVAIVVPAFIFGTSRVIDLLFVVGLAALGLGAMLVAVWRTHRRMASQRAHDVDAATARYAAAYRRAQTDSGPDAGSALRTADLLLEGAKSIHEWPFDDRTQRVAGLLLTSVLTGVLVRILLFALGF